jgi:hypothetical protein
MLEGPDTGPGLAHKGNLAELQIEHIDFEAKRRQRGLGRSGVCSALFKGETVRL